MLLPLFDGVSRVVDATPKRSGITENLRVPGETPVDACDPRTAEDLDLGPGDLLVGVVGPDADAQLDPDALAPLLRRLRPGAQALLLVAWPIEELPRHRLAGPLTGGAGQVIDAVPLDRAAGHGVHCALVVRCVDPAGPPPADLEVLADLEVKVADLRERLAAREGELAAVVAERDARLAAQQARLAKLRNRLDLLESSVSYQLGRMLVTGLRHPARGLIAAPRNVARVWRTVRARNRPPVTAKPEAPTRVVPIALPPARSADGMPGLLTMTAPAGLLVPRKLAENGLAAYEPGALACFLAALDVAGPGAVLDVGANVGVYAALASALADRDVVAFEPTPDLVTVARDFAAGNKLGYRVEALALGAANGTARLYLSTSSDTSNSLAAGYRTSWAHVDVPVETLDSYLARTGLVPAVMKVDTETTEPDVLRGAAESIARHRPWILCEVLAGRAEDTLAEAIAPHGYHWYHVTEDIPYRKADQITGDKTYRYLMWLFAPEEPTERFWTALRQRTEAVAACTAGRATELAAGNGRASAGARAG